MIKYSLILLVVGEEGNHKRNMPWHGNPNFCRQIRSLQEMVINPNHIIQVRWDESQSRCIQMLKLRSIKTNKKQRKSWWHVKPILYVLYLTSNYIRPKYILTCYTLISYVTYKMTSPTHSTNYWFLQLTVRAQVMKSGNIRYYRNHLKSGY